VLVVGIAIVFGLLSAVRIGAQPQAQNASANAPEYAYEVASIKPSGALDGNSLYSVGIRYTPDGFTAGHFPLKALLLLAFGVLPDRLPGIPDWTNSELYDVDAKMDSSVADALKKLSPDQLRIARQHMLQALLADRFKLTFHRESKELPVYLLVVGKNGTKLQEAKADDTSAPEIKAPDGQTLPKGAIQVNTSISADGMHHFSAPGITINGHAGMLGAQLGRPVLDRTGLAGKFDVALQWIPERRQMQTFSVGSSDGQPSVASARPDSNGPSLQAAVQEQLGLKLESGNGSVETIVIDHLEKPYMN
jgi:uncharacterized protein (TIGR03435 family)